MSVVSMPYKSIKILVSQSRTDKNYCEIYRECYKLIFLECLGGDPPMMTLLNEHYREREELLVKVV